MVDNIIETTTHDYEPVNKYIDEKARLRRTRSVWGYTRSLSLFLVALGIFLILAAYAYHIFKKPHQLIESNKTQNERVVKDLIEKDNEIKDLKRKLESDTNNQELQDKIKKLEEEKKQMEEKLKQENEKIVDGKRVVYNETAVKFSKYPEDPKVGEVIVTTGFQWETVDAMRYGERHSSSWCYIGKVGEGEGMSYWFDKPDQDQSVVLREMGITKSEAESYNKYCTN